MKNSQTTPGNREADGNDKFALSPPAVTLPKGGGAIRGVGEKFAANSVTGTGSMSVPIATSPAALASGHSFRSPMILARVMGRSDLAGACRYPPSLARLTRAYPNIGIPKTRTSLFC